MWTGWTDKDGYGQIRVGGTDKVRVGAHVAAWFLDTGGWPPPETPCVLHDCDEPSCVNDFHLWVGTHDENMADMVAKQRASLGIRNSNAKLTEADIAYICSKRGILLQRELAEQFSVHQTTISAIQTGRRWRHLTMDVAFTD